MLAGSEGSELERLTETLEERLHAAESERDQFARALSVLPFAVALIDDDGTIAASSNAYTELSSRVRALRGAGEKWVAPDGNQVTIREVFLDGGSQRLVFVTPR